MRRAIELSQREEEERARLAKAGAQPDQLSAELTSQQAALAEKERQLQAMIEEQKRAAEQAAAAERALKEKE